MAIYVQGVKVGEFSASDLNFSDDVQLTFGDGDDAAFVWSTSATNDQLRIGLAGNMALSIMDLLDIETTTNITSPYPVLYLHGTDHNEWGRIGHDGVRFNIMTDSGSDLRLFTGGSAHVIVGIGSSSHGFADQGDLLVSNNIEIDGAAFLDGAQYNHSVVVAAATYDLLVTDYILMVAYTATGTVAITLPTAQSLDGRTIVIKDSGFTAGTNNITIGTGGSELVENGATLVLSTNGQSVKLISDGTDWLIVG